MNGRLQYGLRIGGKEVFTARQKPHKRIYDGVDLGEIAQAELEHIDQACQSAADAQLAYAALPIHERSRLLQKLADELIKRRQEAAEWIVVETAKPFKLALAEIDRAATTFQLSAEEAKRLHGESFRLDAVNGGEGKFGITRLEPLGVIAAITPFNFPFNLVAHKLGPALAAGNGVVLKPSAMTPLCANWIVEAIERVGFPSGIVNLLFGSGAMIGDRLVAHPQIQAVSFTGSESVGRQIRSQSGLRKTILELGSNSAVLIDEAVDLEPIIPKLINGSFGFCGQVCISIQRIAVHRNNAASLITQMKAYAERLKVTDQPFDPETDLSVMINLEAVESIKKRIEAAKSAGATVITGDQYDKQMVWPTILTDCQSNLEVVREELFAPVVVIEVFDEWSHGIRWINQSRFGLNTGVFTNHLQRAWQAANQLQSGAVLINEIPTWRSDQMPYGGVKDSGTGREGVPYAVRELSHEKLIVFNGT